MKGVQVLLNQNYNDEYVLMVATLYENWNIAHNFTFCEVHRILALQEDALTHRYTGKQLLSIISYFN